MFRWPGGLYPPVKQLARQESQTDAPTFALTSNSILLLSVRAANISRKPSPKTMRWREGIRPNGRGVVNNPPPYPLPLGPPPPPTTCTWSPAGGVRGQWVQGWSVCDVIMWVDASVWWRVCEKSVWWELMRVCDIECVIKSVWLRLCDEECIEEW